MKEEQKEKHIKAGKVFFSVITVCYNVKEKLQYTVKNILAQEFERYELIIVDGDSQDGTSQFLKEIKENSKVKIICEPDRGLYDAMNKGILASKGSHIIFMNAGDIFDAPDVLERLSSLCKNERGVYYGISKAVYPNGQVRSNRIFRRTHKNLLYDVFDGKMPNHQAVVAGRIAFENNLFDLNYKYGADFCWFAKCVKSGIPIIQTNVCIAHFEVGGKSSRPSASIEMWNEHENILIKVFPIRYRVYRFLNPR